MPAKPSLVVAKLGGSVLTDKSRLKTFRPRVAARLAREVAEARHAGVRLVLVHGAGSFGHVRAKRLGLAAGFPPDAGDDARVLGFAQVHADVRELHALVIAALHRAGVPAVGVPPIACARLREGELASLDESPFRLALDAGLVPVAFGDAVMDESRRVGILGGDGIAGHLATALAANRVVFATAADGVFDRDPAEPGARLLGRIHAKELEAVAWGRSRVADVTRGMSGKAAAMAALAEHGIEVAVVNGDKPRRFLEACAMRKWGPGFVGTLVEARR